MSPVKSAASSPPAPGRSSMMTSRLVVRVALDERQAQLLLDRRERLLAGRELALEVGAHLGVLSLSSNPRASAIPWLASRQRWPSAACSLSSLCRRPSCAMRCRSEATAGSESSRSTSASACSICVISSSIRRSVGEGPSGPHRAGVRRRRASPTRAAGPTAPAAGSQIALGSWSSTPWSRNQRSVRCSMSILRSGLPDRLHEVRLLGIWEHVLHAAAERPRSATKSCSLSAAGQRRSASPWSISSGVVMRSAWGKRRLLPEAREVSAGGALPSRDRVSSSTGAPRSQWRPAEI